MSPDSQKTVLFRMNGVAAGFLREYGCRSCPQCSSSKPQAHTSASLFIKKGWDEHRETYHHILFDCGLGAIDSLIDFGSPWVQQLFISHGHAYHSLGLDRLVWGQVRHGGATPIEVYCTVETFKAGPKRIYPWFCEPMDGKPPLLQHYAVNPLTPILLGLDINLRITPVPVYQGQSAPGAVIWVVEFGEIETQTYKKIVLGWELVHFIPRFPSEDRASTYTDDNPTTEQMHLADIFGNLLSNVDELFFDGNTITPRADTNHMSIEAGLRFLIPETNAKRTWIVHYSGHEDPGGPLSYAQLQDWVDQAKQDKFRNLVAGKDIRIAQHGMQLCYCV